MAERSDGEWFEPILERLYSELESRQDRKSRRERLMENALAAA